MRRGRPPARVSEKRKEGRAEWDRTVDRVLRRDRWTCQAAGYPVYGIECRGRLDPHHVLPRARGGTDDDANLVTLCRAHHDAVHAYPEESILLGLLVHSWDASKADGPDYPTSDG